MIPLKHWPKVEEKGIEHVSMWQARRKKILKITCKQPIKAILTQKKILTLIMLMPAYLCDIGKFYKFSIFYVMFLSNFKNISKRYSESSWSVHLNGLS